MTFSRQAKGEPAWRRRKDEGGKTVLCSVFRAPREYNGQECSEYSGIRLNTSWETWLGDVYAYSASRRRSRPPASKSRSTERRGERGAGA